MKLLQFHAGISLVHSQREREREREREAGAEEKIIGSIISCGLPFDLISSSSCLDSL